jgi:hypothetical protein
MANGADSSCLLLPRMNRTARCETQCREAVYKLITSIHSKRYWLIHRQNSYAAGGAPAAVKGRAMNLSSE